MREPPTPQLNLVVLRSGDMERAVQFYRLLGLEFEKHRHGSGLEHYASMSGEVVFEIYPLEGDTEVTTGTRLGFQVISIEDTLARLAAHNTKIVLPPRDSHWGRRAVVADPDGHKVELSERAE